MQNLRSNFWRVSRWSRKDDFSCTPVSKTPALLSLSLSHRVSAGALVAGRNSVNAGGRIEVYCPCFAPADAFQDQQLCSGECLFMKGEANICNQDVGKCTFQNVLQIKLCLSFWCSFPILMRLQLFSFLFFLRWPHTFEKAHLWIREQLRNCIVICKTHTHLFPSWSDLNSLSCLFTPTLFPSFVTSKDSKYQLKN